MKKKIMAFLVAFLTAAGFALPYTVSAEEGEETAVTDAAESSLPTQTRIELAGEVSRNASKHNYINRDRWAAPINSYLTENSDGTLSRVEYINGIVYSETYSSDGTLLSTVEIAAELPIFGGFYSGSKYNFLVFGQTNKGESDSTEVVHIVKYSKDWEKLSYASVKGANTTVPFDAGCPRMEEYGGKLYLHTSHEMYASEGVNHQANMTFIVDEESMKVLESSYDIAVRTGYTSHSFNQFIKIDGKDVYRIEHADAFPARGVLMTRFPVSGSLRKVTEYANLIEIMGNEGANDTGLAVGGFELSEDNCIVAGNTVNQSPDSYDYNGQRNIFVNVTSKSTFGGGKTTFITNYSESDNIKVYNPHLTKVNNDLFIVMWEEYDKTTYKLSTKGVSIDGNGAVLDAPVQLSVNLSDCQPLVCSDGYIRWYVSNGAKVYLYSVDPYDLEAASTITLPLGDLNDDEQININDVKLILIEYISNSTGYEPTLTKEQKKAADVNGDGFADAVDACLLLNYYAYRNTGGTASLEKWVLD